MQLFRRLPRAPLALGALLGLWACGDTAVPSLADSGTGAAQDAGAARDASAPRDGGSEGRDGSAGGDAGTVRDNCDPLAQTGCTPPATKCVVEGPPPPGARCVEPGADEFNVGEVCLGRDCAAGLACVRESTTSTTSRCVKICDVDTAVGCEGLGDDYDCAVRISQSNWGACVELPPICDPYTQNPCAATDACQPYRRRNGSWEFRCFTAGTGEPGALCTSGNPRCQRGLACVRTADGNAFCRAYCELSTDCTAPEQCAGSVVEPPFMYCAQ